MSDKFSKLIKDINSQIQEALYPKLENDRNSHYIDHSKTENQNKEKS